ncbi:MAG TPA: hypothetical protein VKS44_01995 [Candidatus Acidoferrales bacterium]|jgi:hypothetical protein|nr:hypothetical protein [Candidatus Acidoferrales bacterium]
MKQASVLAVAALAAVFFTPAVHAQDTNTSVIPGTQMRLTLLNGLSTRVAHDGDPFTAVVAEPVFSGNHLVLPAGAKIHGTVMSVERPRWFSMFRGGASMNINFRSVEIESRIFPARMSILSIYTGSTDMGNRRKDLQTVEGVVVEQKQNIKNDVEDVAIGTAGGSTLGLVFSRVLRGTVIGLVGGSAYVVARKGKEVDLPAQTGMIVRLDSQLSLPESLLRSASYAPVGNTASGN